MATPIFTLLNPCQELTSSGIHAEKNKLLFVYLCPCPIFYIMMLNAFLTDESFTPVKVQLLATSKLLSFLLPFPCSCLFSFLSSLHFSHAEQLSSFSFTLELMPAPSPQGLTFNPKLKWLITFFSQSKQYSKRNSGAR